MNYLNRKTPQLHFEQAVTDIYVDKSGLLEITNAKIKTKDKYLCVTRPRRFGKTINANMLAAYYSKGCDSAYLFEGLTIARTQSYKKHLNKHNVIYIDFSRFPDTCNNFEDYLNYVKANFRESLHAEHSTEAIWDLLDRSEKSYIFVMDEWDAVFYKDFMQEKDRIAFLDFLRNLLKDQIFADLVYMTGVMPIAKYSSGSALNIFHEYNFMNDASLDRYFGFTDTEVKQLCKQYSSVSYDELSKWYNGYFTHDGERLFNPRSVSFALKEGICQNYWTSTGPMDEVEHYIRYNIADLRNDIVQMVSGLPVEITLREFGAENPRLKKREEILAAMVVYGFLSYHDGKLQIPNKELMMRFEDAVKNEEISYIHNLHTRSLKLLKATIEGNTKYVEETLSYIHDSEIPILQYNDENSLACVVSLAYISARDEYRIEREEASGKGYADFIFHPKSYHAPAIILELKVGKSCNTAIQQIIERNYMMKVLGCKEIIMVGINYDRNTKQHMCIIEKYKKD